MLLLGRSDDEEGAVDEVGDDDDDDDDDDPAAGKVDVYSWHTSLLPEAGGVSRCTETRDERGPLVDV